jgi:mannose-6-phosphate isomerase-like protein (cupin superfamily)
MADYTRLNIKEDVEDQAPKFGLSPQLEYRVGREPLELENSGVSYLRMGPGFRMPFGHHHGKQEEVYVLLSGSARLKLDDEVIDLQPFDTVRIAKDTMRNLEGGPDGAELILIGAPKTGPGDADMEQGWWND